jgi:hypothetical protein
MKPDRIDFVTMSDGRTIVNKFRQDRSRDIPTSHEIKPTGFDLEAALAWCRENDYIIHKWNGDARAWRNQARPVRTAYQLLRMRRSLEAEWNAHWNARTEQNCSADHHPGSRWHQVKILLKLDLAYDG